MGNACAGGPSKKGITHRRDYQPSQTVKSEEIDRAVAKEETTTSYENITKIYNFKKELGEGHFGKVRLSTLIGNPNQKYAIKAIEKAKLKKDLYLLKRELQILRKLDHPNVIKFYETYQDEKYFYLVMEYCSGGELLDKIAKEGRLKENEVCQIMRQSFSAIKYLHTLGVVHRDIKPENFLFASPEPNSDIKIIDFGLSKFLGDAPGGRLTTAVGTAIYMAPEVIKGSYDERCDNWSLGVFMYVLLSGAPPFEGDNSNAVFQNILKLKYTFDKPEWKKISAQAKNLIKGLLVLKPEERLSASEALESEWFKKSIVRRETITSPTTKAMEMIKKFRGNRMDNELKLEARKFMVNSLSPNEIKEYREMFQFLDTEDTGFVSADSLRKTMDECGVMNIEEEIGYIMNKTGSNKGQGLINYSAFLMLVLDAKTLYSEERLKLSFRHFDIKNSGEITSENIKEVMARSGRRTTDEEIKKMLKGVELAKPGRVNFEEFKQILD